MADNKIVHRVSLEGADKVSKQLESIGDVGEKSFNKVKQAADGASLGKVGESSSGFGGKTEESRLAAERLREVLHTLHPILDQAGLGLGNLGAFARVAGAGFLAFGAAIVGSVIVGLAKMAEEADRAKARLSALAGGDERGNSLFTKLSEQAKRLGGDVSDLQKPLEELIKFQQKALVNPSVIHPANYDPSSAAAQSAAKVRVFSGNQESPGGPPTDQTLTGAVGTLLAAAKVDRQSIQEAAGPAAEFFKALRTGGKLTPELIDSLSPTQQSTLTKALSSSTAAGGTGQQFQSPAALSQFSTTHTISAGQVLQTLSDYEPTIHKQADAVQGTTAAFEHLETSAKELAKTFGDVAHVGEGVEKFAKAIESASDTIDKFFHPQDYEPGGKKTKEEGPPAPAPFVPKSLREVLTRGEGLHGFLTGDIPTQLSTYLNSGKTGGINGGNPFGTTADFLSKAATNPGAIPGNKDQSLPPLPGYKPPPLIKSTPEAPSLTNGPRSEAGSAAEEPLRSVEPSAGPAANPPEFQYIPPPKQEFQPIPPPKNEFQPIPPPKEDQPHVPTETDPRNSSVRFKTASPLVNITDKDINNAIRIGLSAGPGSIADAVGSLRAGAKSVVGYHGTSGEHLDSILKGGINVGEDKNAWVSARDSFAALTAETKSGGIGKGNPVVLKVDIPADKFQESFRKLNQGGDWSTASTDKNIPPEWISGFHNVDKETGKLGPLQTLGPRSDAGEPAQTQQIASLGSQLQSFIETISSALNSAGAKDLNQGGKPVEGIGIRGEGEATKGFADLGQAAESAAAALALVAEVKRGSDETVAHVAGGGHIRGPGTSTSDSIPAMLSDGEYVMKAAAVSRIGVDKLDAANNGAAHFAEGGLAGPGPLTTGEYSVTFDPDTGGAFINGNFFPPGSPILDDPKIKAAIEQSKAGAKDQSPKPKHKSQFIVDPDFGGHFASGGLVGDHVGKVTRGHFATGGLASSSASSFAERISAMGLGTINIPHFAVGGMPEMPADVVELAD